MDKLAQQQQEDEYVLNELLRIFEVEENEKRNAGYKAAAIMAADVGVAIFNVFRSIQIGQEHRHLRAIMDLCFKLNSNGFWAQHAPRLMPVIQMALNAHVDKVMFLGEKGDRHDLTLYDPLIISGRSAPLEVFSAIAFCLGGESLMLTTSAQIKRSLMRYFQRD